MFIIYDRAKFWSRDSKPGRIRPWAGQPSNRRSNPHKGKDFYILWNVHTGLGTTRSYIQREPGPISSGVEWPEREADHSPPSTAKDMYKWIYACHHPIRLNGVDRDKIRHLLVLLQPVIPQNCAHIFKKKQDRYTFNSLQIIVKNVILLC